MCLYHAKKMSALTRLSNFTCIKQSRVLMKSFIKAVCLLHFNPLTINVPYRIETSQLILNANQLTGFYMMGNTAYYCVNMNISWLGRDVNNKIKNLHKRLLHLFYQDKNRFFLLGNYSKFRLLSIGNTFCHLPYSYLNFKMIFWTYQQSIYLQARKLTYKVTCQKLC